MVNNMIFKILFRAIFFYFMIIFAYKFMGKRELGELSLVDFVISTIMSQIIAISIENYKEPLLFKSSYYIATHKQKSINYSNFIN